MENEFLDLFNTVGMGTTIWSPLASGLLSGKYNDGIPEGSRLSLSGFEWLKDKVLLEDRLKKIKKLGEFAAKLGTSVAALSVAWCIKNPHVSTAILGATKKEQLLDNLQALELQAKLTPEVMEKIEKIMQTKPQLPEY